MLQQLKSGTAATESTGLFVLTLVETLRRCDIAAAQICCGESEHPSEV
jgi:hypothetical protein